MGWPRVPRGLTVRCTSAANKQLSRHFTELFSTGDEALADQILSPDVVFHGTAADGEVRTMVERIERLNALDTALVQSGQRLRVPLTE